ncbi:MAG: V4R domain-containing protein [Candidatus Bathyarchaeia archaeon]
MLVLESFNIGRFLFLPGRKVFGVLVESELNPTVLVEISDLGFRHGVLVPTMQYNVIDGEKIVGLGFADLTNADISIEELAEKIRKIEGIKNVQILHPTAEGFVADYLSVKLLLAGDKAIIFRKPGYEGLIVGMREQFGTAGEAFLYHTGYDAGMRYGKSHQDFAAKLGIKDSIQILCKISMPLYISMGLGKPEILETRAKPFKTIIRVYESFECELGVGAKKPYSNFIRGIFAGLLAQLFNRRMEAKERCCVAKGDPYCEFEITPE